MHDIQILQDTLQNQCPTIHKKRLHSLILATQSSLDGADLTLTKLGRALNVMTTAKHAIKRVDRLLGNAIKNSIPMQTTNPPIWQLTTCTPLSTGLSCSSC